MHWPNLKVPSRGVWLATLLLCAGFGLSYWAGLDPIPVMAVVGVLLLIGGVIVRSSNMPHL